MRDERHKPTLLLTVGILALFVPACYDASSYTGDGGVIDRGYRSYYPRFVIEFPELNLAETGNQRYSFRGAPSSEFVFHLNVLNAEPDNSFANSDWEVTRQSLEIIGSDATVTLRDSDGQTVCQASDRLAGGWVPAGTGVMGKTEMTRNFWHHDCNGARLEPSKTYELTIHVTVAESSNMEVFAVPTLEGGGRDS